MPDDDMALQREDRSVIIDEVMSHWATWMQEKGAPLGETASSPEFDPEVGEGYSDYGDHQTLMDATPDEYRMFLAMLAARGITLGGAA